MKFSQYLAYLIQGDNPADISLAELQNRIEQYRNTVIMEAGYTESGLGVA